MKNETKEELKEVLNNNQVIHLKLKDNSWRNGKIVRIENNYFVFKDFKNKEEGFFFHEVVRISPYIKNSSDKGVVEDANSN